MTDWPTLKARIDRADARGVARALHGLPETSRRALVKPLKEYDRLLRPWDFHLTAPAPKWFVQVTVRVAGVGCVTGADAMARWLARDALTDLPEPGSDTWSRHIDVVPIVLEMLYERDLPWLPDLARRLAGRIRGNAISAQSTWRLADALVTTTGIDPPDGDGFLLGWLRWGDPAERVRRDPAWAALIPKVLELAEAGSELRHLAPAFAEVADRAELLDGSLGALQRGGRRGDMSGFLHLHETLAPDTAETAPRARDYAALLSGTHSTVAGMAQRELLRLDDTGLLDLPLLLDASRAILLRPEKKLVRAQLTRLDILAGRGHALDVLPVLATAFAHDAADLQERALKLTIKHLTGTRPSPSAARPAPRDSAEIDAHPGSAGTVTAPPAEPAESAHRHLRHGPDREPPPPTHLGRPASTELRAELAEAAAALPPDLRAVATEAFGGGSLVEPEPALPPWSPRPAPVPIGSPAELAEEFAALYGGPVDLVTVERILAAAVAFAHAGREALFDALRPVMERLRLTPGLPGLKPDSPHYPPLGEFFELSSVICAAVAPPAPVDAADQREWRKRTDDVPWPYPQRAVNLRLHEIAVGLASSPQPFLMAEPTAATGQIDPAVLLARLERAAREGWEPWPLDLEQALSRLPHEIPAAVVEGARRIGTPAAGRLVGWTGLPTPEITAAVPEPPKPCHSWQNPNPPRTFVIVRGAGAYDLTAPESYRHGYYGAFLQSWIGLLPSDADVIAAHLVPHFVVHADRGPVDASLLPLLAEADGPVGVGTALVMLYGLSARAQPDRSAAVDGLLVLAARGRLDGELFGRELGALVARGHVAITRVVPALREVARAGARREVWAMIAAALPEVLREPPNRVADLLALATEVAQPGESIPELKHLTDRPGSSRAKKEAVRLRAVLNSR